MRARTTMRRRARHAPWIALALCALATPAAAQVRVRAALVRTYRPGAGPSLPAPPSERAGLVGFECTRDVSPPFARTRCRVVAPRTLDRWSTWLSPLQRCYGPAGGPLPAPAP